jgi:catechol 2,3-dioxygenase-like lactoylglutathione lyase family enzyme
MISHVFIGISDFSAAFAFYAPLMEGLGLTLKFADAKEGLAGWFRTGQPRPLFVVGRPFNGQPHEAGNGQMTALLAATRAEVDRAHTVALAAGARCEGPPGLRPHYHTNYYGAYFRDLDGNKLCVCCHDALEDH